MKRVRGRQCGFTLIEILIVVAIIGLIAALIGPNLMGRLERSKEEITKAQIEMLSSATQSLCLIWVDFQTPWTSLSTLQIQSGEDHTFRSFACPKTRGGGIINSNALVITDLLIFTLSGLRGLLAINPSQTGNHVFRTDSKRSIWC